MERKGKLLLAATDETPSSAFVPVNVIQLELEKEVECANSASHIARPCPSAAGDYMDYGMIRTPPPLPPSLHGFTLDLNTQRKVLTSEERPPVSPPSPRKCRFSMKTWITNVWPLCELPLSWTKRRLMKRTSRRPPLYISRSWDMRVLKTLSRALPLKPFISFNLIT